MVWKFYLLGCEEQQLHISRFHPHLPSAQRENRWWMAACKWMVQSVCRYVWMWQCFHNIPTGLLLFFFFFKYAYTHLCAIQYDLICFLSFIILSFNSTCLTVTVLLFNTVSWKVPHVFLRRCNRHLEFVHSVSHVCTSIACSVGP